MARRKETVPFELKRLQRDLNEVAPKWASFRSIAAEKGVGMDYDVYRRAKNEGIATMETLAKFATVFGYKVDRYIESAAPRPSAQFDLRGRWTAVYLERPQASVVRTWEALNVEQSGWRLRGEYDFLKTDEPNCPRRESVYKMRGRMIGDLILGTFWVGARPTPDGVGCFQLKLRPSGMLAEGWCTFYGDDGLIAGTRYFWTRSDGSHEAAFQLQAAENRILAHPIYYELPLQ